jgi:hypothetical protein
VGAWLNPPRSSPPLYDYALGGKDNFASDREAVQNLFRLAPENAYVPRANRQFLGPAARFAAEQGIGQFLDLGAGSWTLAGVGRKNSGNAS